MKREKERSLDSWGVWKQYKLLQYVRDLCA
jgi:hypothetical protein